MSDGALETSRPGDTSARPQGDGTGPPARPRRKRQRLAAVAAAVGLIVVTAVVASVATVATDDGDHETSPGETTTTEMGAPPPASGSTQPTSETTAAPSTQASALDTLEPFLSAAATVDDRLRTAARAINGSGPPFSVVTDDVASAVQAADLAAVAREIPAGMPTDLLQQTILVYSDLASRRFAMAGFGYAHEVPGAPTAGSSGELVGDLAHGHEAAQRFGDDVARLRALASDSGPLAVAAAGSRVAAEVQVHVATVNAANGGCDGRGGAVFTSLLPIAWHSDTRGTVGDITFEATPGDGGWDVRLNAC